MAYKPYNYSPFFYQRKKTREVKIGDISIGSNYPIRIQSMTNTNTRDTKSTVEQILDLERAGCEIVRLTVPSKVDADNLIHIRKELKKEKSQIPLVADIHFTPTVALKVVDFVEKVRINPGNFVDKKKFAVREYTEKEYNLELEKIYDVFSPLVLKCKKNQVAMRIGTNHGSLSDRIMNRYGDSPLGMVESALEFIKIAQSHSFFDIVISMKASNTRVMVQAYRLLLSRFIELDMDYPIHLGVTEAGDGREGIIKSAVGIGSLLEDGIGDTIRVSLTGSPLDEIPVAKAICSIYNKKRRQIITDTEMIIPFNPYQYSRRDIISFKGDNFKTGLKTPILTEVIEENDQNLTQENLKNLREQASKSYACLESIFIKNTLDLSYKDDNTYFSVEYSKALNQNIYTKFKVSLEEKFDSQEIINLAKCLKFIEIQLNCNLLNSEQFKNLIQLLKKNSFSNIIFSLKTKNLVYDYRKLACLLKEARFPILLSYESTLFSEEDFYRSVIGFGGLLIDGIGDMIRLKVFKSQIKNIETMFDILQATRARISKTEYIACPSCGRTLFDLKQTTERIKKRTSHLKSLKIAVMGCIVNGPGEMADADFGYVGAGPGKVHLYKGKEIVVKSIPSETADQRLEELIRENGMWEENLK